MATVISPMLVKLGDDLVNTSDVRWWVCIYELQEMIEVPKAKQYWLEASNQQWNDNSGTRVIVKYNTNSYWWRKHNNGLWQYLPRVPGKALEQLDIKLDGKAKVIYFRLLYEK